MELSILDDLICHETKTKTKSNEKKAGIDTNYLKIITVYCKLFQACLC